MASEMERVLTRARQIKLVIFDVDGVLTDGRLYFDPQGREFKGFHARDGHGLKLLQRTGVETAVISGRKSPSVALRMESLGIRHVYQGYENKLEALKKLQQVTNVPLDHTACVGDDILDLPILCRVHLAIAVQDAHFAVKERVHWVTRTPGGFGAAREVCDLIMQAQQTFDVLLKQYLP